MSPIKVKNTENSSPKKFNKYFSEKQHKRNKTNVHSPDMRRQSLQVFAKDEQEANA